METFKRIPYGEEDLRISKDGELRSFDGSRIPRINTVRKGYKRIWVKHEGVWRSYSIHRLVAELYVEKPERHKDKDLASLHVNHIDGVKDNNKSINLEWVTALENMRHAREIGLFSNQKEVLVKNIETGYISCYGSLSDAARAFLVSPQILSRHLNSLCAGLAAKDGHVFMFKSDAVSWPNIDEIEIPLDDLNRIYDLIAENVDDGRKILFASLPQACSQLGLNINIVKNTKTRKGPDEPVNGWIFYPLDDTL